VQMSLYVAALLSLHALFVFGVALQAPVAELHAMTLHCPLGSKDGNGHTTGAPVQTPAWHVSPVVHGLPSLQAVPSAIGSHSQPSPMQTAVVQVPHFGLPDSRHDCANEAAGVRMTAARNVATAVRQSIDPPALKSTAAFEVERIVGSRARRTCLPRMADVGRVRRRPGVPVIARDTGSRGVAERTTGETAGVLELEGRTSRLRGCVPVRGFEHDDDALRWTLAFESAAESPATSDTGR